MFRSILSVLLALSVLPAVAGAQQTFDVYIIAGQSNADGRGEVGDLSDTQLLSLQNSAIISYLNPGSERERAIPVDNDFDAGTVGFQPLVPGGFSVDSTSSRTLSDTFGPELSFGASIAEATGSTNQIAIIKVTRGGTNLRSDWSADPSLNVDSGPDEPAGFLYRALLEEVAASLALLEADGSTANLEGFVWHQGESDSNSVSGYADRFVELVEGVRGEFGDDIPFVLGELSRTRDNSVNFNDNLPNVVSSAPGLSFISSEGLTTNVNNDGTLDTTHFDANGQVELGQRFAAAFATTSVPEPSSGLLVVALGLGMAVRRNRIR